MPKPRPPAPTLEASRAGRAAAAPDVGDLRYARVRELCFGFPGVEEKLSHGRQAFFVAGKMFARFVDDGHGDGRIAVWCKAEPARQRELVAADPTRHFVPPYVGKQGWVGVLVEPEPDWEALTILLEDGWASVAPASVAEGPVLPAPAPVVRGKTERQVAAAALARLEALCAELPNCVCERDAWHAAFRVGKKAFLYFCDNHHGDGIVGAWIKMTPGASGPLVGKSPQRFFVPPYLGARGWLGVYLDRPATDWDDLAARVREAYAAVAPKRRLRSAPKRTL